MNNYTFGEEVFFIKEQTFGKYITHHYDSGYCVPHVFIGTDEEWEDYEDHIKDDMGPFMGEVSRPWDNEICSEKELTEEIEKLESKLKSQQELLATLKKAKSS
jgi:hypothetical protein